jgi:hypothetical protein
MSSSVACGFDNAGSKCKKMYRFKISAEAGIQWFQTSLDPGFHRGDALS